ncbi:hypothetical protein FMUND_377 [Fusarium mundagurra]|uniref:2EXR domain-containing protein n=1 Tax=Fusarium mundagurra TaxID=1567541 RepID=A0A8H5Z7P5_9HYPO|nr:hypothetical protein FMUND_377 [Fusarium mundagurra]
MASFRRFANLPKELRDTIWDYASQRNLAGVQIFELRTAEPKQDGENSDTTTSGNGLPRQQLAPPLRSKCFPALDGSPGTSNVSRYMADIGLWTACKESREVMEKTTQRARKILEMQEKDEYRYYNWEEHVPAIISCSTSQRFLVQPHADLFVIQPSKIEDIDWSQVARDIRKQFEPRGFGFGINIGIEWNVEWGIKKDDDDFNLLCEAFRDIKAQLWTIDTNLRRKEDMDHNSKDFCGKVFYACDRKFLEVNWGFQPLERWRHIIPPPEETRFGRTEYSTSLARGLHSIKDDSHGRYIFYGQYGEEEDERFRCDVKLLGWDDL